ncbi:MAG: glycosyltransferase [Burkholderiales bacterium]|nr:glycosyltransferase [Burkholderiales bacterium]
MNDASLGPSTAAIVVVFRHDVDPRPLLAQLAGLVRRVIVVDNSADGHPALRQLAATVLLIHNQNRGGLAGAYNSACEQLQQDTAIRQVVLMDEDSDPGVLSALLSDPTVIATLNDERTAALAPAYRDRATGLRGRHIQLRRFGLSYLAREFEGQQPVSFLINSMSVWRMAALRRIGRFNEGLAIDHVDTEYCLRARRAGLALYLNGSHEFAHAIGERRRFTLFGVQMQAGGHGPERRYLIGRNTVWLGLHYWWREPAFALLCLKRLVYEAIGIAMVEPQRRAKIWALLRGAFSGLFAGQLR